MNQCPCCHGTGKLTENPMLQLRRKHGWSIRKAASMLGVSHGHLDDMEKGRRAFGAWLEVAKMEYPKQA